MSTLFFCSTCCGRHLEGRSAGPFAEATLGGTPLAAGCDPMRTCGARGSQMSVPDVWRAGCFTNIYPTAGVQEGVKWVNYLQVSNLTLQVQTPDMDIQAPRDPEWTPQNGPH